MTLIRWGFLFVTLKQIGRRRNRCVLYLDQIERALTKKGAMEGRTITIFSLLRSLAISLAVIAGFAIIVQGQQFRTTRRASFALGSVNNPQDAQGERVSLARMVNRSTSAVAREVRHELLSDLSYYSVFDWIEFEVLPDNSVVLSGEVTTPPDTKSRAEDVVEDVPGVTRVVNEIRVLPVSPNDDRVRRALYRAIYGFNSPLFRYSISSRRAIHIIVDRGRVTLKGVVDTEGDRNLAYLRARQVAGLFEVNNELVVDGRRQVPL